MYVQPKNAAKGSAEKGRSWVYVGSANCSKSAWCIGRYTFMKNCEAGVVLPIPAKTEKVEGKKKVGSEAQGLEVFEGVVPIPLRLPSAPLNNGNMPYFSP